MREIFSLGDGNLIVTENGSSYIVSAEIFYDRKGAI